VISLDYDLFVVIEKAIKLCYEDAGLIIDGEYSGTIKCPRCNNKLIYTISGYTTLDFPLSNKFCHGKCETDGCLEWTQ